MSVLSRLATLLVMIAALLSLSCGGGGGGESNENPPGSVSISAVPESTLVQVEMLKDVSPNQLNVTVTASSNLSGNLSPTAAVVRLDRYELTYTRADGGVNVGAQTGNLGLSISAPVPSTTLPENITIPITVFQTNDKLYSPFALDFSASLDPVTFNCQITIFGTNNGDQRRTTTNFTIQAAVFSPFDTLVPIIESFNQTTELEFGDDYLASWRTSRRVDQGVLTLPWGQRFTLDGQTNQFFPFGDFATTTRFLDIAEGETQTFPSGSLVVANPFGSAASIDAGDVTVTRPAPPQGEPLAPVNILQFYADKSTIVLGDEVTLFWVVEGDIAGLSLLPAEYGGEVVDFTGLDPSFGSIVIRPTDTTRPILKATGLLSGDFDSTFLAETITVLPDPEPPAPTPPAIAFFQVDRTTVPVFGQVSFFWFITGDIEKVELFPFNGNVVEVTGLTSFLSPAFLRDGAHTFSLVAFGPNGTFDKRDVVVNAVNDFNLPVAISNLVQEPARLIDNDDDASFSFTVTDPERKDSSWRVRKIAGDDVSFFPSDGVIESGLGSATVAIDDDIDNDNGFIIFELSAYDDPVFGFSNGTTKDVRLVTFETTGVHSDTAPVITAFEFLPTGPAAAPGTQGSISFTFTDPDTLDLDWEIDTAAGDTGGTFSRRRGTVNTGSATIQTTYNDDADTPTASVVFLVRVTERRATNPQSAVATLLVDKGAIVDPDNPGGGGGTTGSPITIPFANLYANFAGTPQPTQAFTNFTVYFNGDLADPRFFRNPDLSGETVGVSYVLDFSHLSCNPEQIISVNYSRGFQVPAGSPGNNGVLSFVGYLGTSGSLDPPQVNPIVDGVVRYRMTFTVEDFRPDLVSAYNLPTMGTAPYVVTINATDQDGNVETLTKTINIVVP